MANINRVNGFRPVGHLNGSPFNGQATTYVLPASNAVNTFVGDLVTVDTAGDPTTGLTTVKQAVAGGVIVGVIVGFDIDPTDMESSYRKASTRRKVLVADSPDLLLEVQGDGALSTASVGLNMDFVVGTGSVTTGASAMQADVSTAATTATLPLRVVSFDGRIDNELNAASNKLTVRINKHANANGVAGV